MKLSWSQSMAFMFELKGTPDEYSAGLELTIERSSVQETGTYVKFSRPARIRSD
jgi:hypothetical protein